MLALHDLEASRFPTEAHPLEKRGCSFLLRQLFLHRGFLDVSGHFRRLAVLQIYQQTSRLRLHKVTELPRA